MTNASMYPCIWFDTEAHQAVEFYQSIFKSISIISKNDFVVYFEFDGTKFMALNGGKNYKPSPAVSYFVYCGGDENKIDTIYEQLSQDGTILMPLNTYDWSAKYAWVIDKYGVSWQLDIDPINNPQKIVPALLLVNEKASKVNEVCNYYLNVFNDSKLMMTYGGETPAFAQLKLNNYLINIVSGEGESYDFDFTGGNSFVVECNTQHDIDTYWNYFLKDGEESMCGWIKDKYGVWWQIIPAVLKDLMSNPDTAQKASAAFFKMKKFDIATLLNAVK